MPLPSIPHYDVTPQERRNIEDRAALRKELRVEFLKKFQNPHQMATGEGGYLFDPALQRWIAMRSFHWRYFKPSVKTLHYPLGIAALVGLTFKIIWDGQQAKEQKYRTGQVSYRDRRDKFR